MKLAYFSPLSPQRSGIADYSAELLPHLAAGAEITLFVDGFQPTNRELTSRFEVLDYRRRRSALKLLDQFDATLYHMGNDHRYHAGMFAAMERHPGVVVFHDFALQDFFLGLARERRAWRLYLDEVDYCYGQAAREEAAAALDHGATPAIVTRPLEFPLNRRIANSAEAIIVHSEWARARFAKLAPTVPVKHIAMPISLPADDRLRTNNNEVHIASFGLVQPGKGIEHALRALATLKKEHSFRYYLVGEANAFFDVRELIRRYGLEDRVEITGHVTLDEFKRHIDQTDIALNFRERTVGETSASLCRLMAAGVCSIVSDAGWYGELPGDSVVKIPLDRDTDALFVAYLKRLIEDQPLRRRIGENARAHAVAEHDVKARAADYVSFLREVIDRRPRRRLLAEVSQEIAGLGVKASDEQFLRSVATEIASVLPVKIASIAAAEISGNPSGNGKGRAASASFAGRLPKVEGLDYKRAAIEYLGRLSAERQHHLRTKPFYNLANKPAKYKSAGLDEDSHRHFCDFANIAVHLSLPPGSSILDVGCGSGWLSEYFARLGYVVKGIDISPGLVEMSRERVARVAYGVDHETHLRCTFDVHDIEQAPLAETFDAVLCYDSLHHFEDERAVVGHIAAMLKTGGVLFILEGERPTSGSASEAELRHVMREFRTLESPFDYAYLRQLLEENGLAVVGDFVSVNGLFERELIEDDMLPLENFPIEYHYLSCKKVAEGAPASSVPDSRHPSLLRARIELKQRPPSRIAPGETLALDLKIENTGDTLWLAGRIPRAGIVMPAIRIYDEANTLLSEVHGEPLLPRALSPGETIRLKVEHPAPQRRGRYTLKFDLVDEHVCWFEAAGSQPLSVAFAVIAE